MTIDELRKQCEKSIRDGWDGVVLVLPWVSKGEKIRLCKSSGPLGEILNVNSNGETVARFSAKKLLEYIDAA